MSLSVRSELVLVWTNLHRRLNTPKQTLLEACHQLMLSVTNVKSIFPFIRAILQEVGEAGVQFCVELCANALRSCLPCDAVTKTLLYKTIAGLLPSDLDVCRACALLVFFLERTVESYKMVYLLYLHPDQEYHVDDSPIGNNIRFETLQILKKDLYFDPEFWNLMALRTNCLKLMSEKVVSAALEEIMEDKWISKYCRRGSALRSVCQRGAAAKKRHHKEDRFCKRDSSVASKKFKMDTDKLRLNSHALKRGKQGSRALRESSSGPLRRSFWQLDRIHGSLTLRYDEHRRTTRFSERNMPKRKIKKPKWLLEDSGALENVPLKIKRNGLKRQKLLRSCVIKRSQAGPIKNNAKVKPPENTHLKAKENKYQNGLSLDSGKPANPPQIILELSLPDNELTDTFNDDSCSKAKRFSQVLLYKQTLKYAETSPPAKTGHGKEVILRARDAAMFVQLLHCYARRQKGKGSGSNLHSSVSTITRSSAQGSPSKDSEVSERPKGATLEKVREKLKDESTKEAIDSSRIPETENVTSGKDPSGGIPPPTSNLPQVLPIPSGEAFEEPAVEMKVTIASQASVLDKVSKSPTGDDVAQVSEISKVVNNKKRSSEEVHPVSINNNDSGKDVALKREEQEIKPSSSPDDSMQSGDVLPNAAAEVLKKSPKGNVPNRNDKSPAKNINPPAACRSTSKAGASDKPTRTLAAGVLTAKDVTDRDLSRSQRGKGKTKVAEKTQTTASSASLRQEAPVVEMQVKKRSGKAQDAHSETSENSELTENAPETEESKLEHHCTFCSKFFTGARVVEHAMFHFRRDECTFCQVTFKDDLLAMMHLSDHIEKMKRLKAEEQGVSAQKASGKAKTTSAPPGHKEKPKKTPQSPADINPPEPRTLRSNHGQTSATPSHLKQTSRRVSEDATVHRVNGHIGKKDQAKRLKRDSEPKQESVQRRSSEERRRFRALHSRLRENRQIKSDRSASGQTSKVLRSSEDEKKRKETSQLQLNDSKKIEVENLEKVCCPASRCSWFTDVSKNRVGLLYHALDKHHGDIKPLELAFDIGNSKCSICMRVMWSFEHFKHHVERHRLAPRHPCPHRGCKARFKSGMEMRRHARKHSPLQATCCQPGCSELFICLWALNLHEREHYASKACAETKTPDGKKTQSSEDAVRNAALRLREKAAPVSASTTPQQIKLRPRNKSLDSDASEKDASPQPTTINLRLRQALDKARATSQAPKSHKVFSSLRHKSKLKRRLKSKNFKIATRGLKRRRCPPRLSKMAANQKIPSEEARMVPRVSTRTKTEKGRSEPGLDEEMVRRITRNQTPSKSQSTGVNQSGLDKRKPTGDKKKPKKVKNHCAPSDFRKLKKNKNGKVEATCQKKSSASNKPLKSKPIKVKAEVESSVENKDSAPSESSSAEVVVPTECAEKTSAIGKEENQAVTLSTVELPKKGEALKKRLNQKGKEEDKQDKAKGAEGILKGLKQLIKSTLVEKEKRKEAPENAAMPAIPPVMPTDTACPSKVPKENKQSANKKEKLKKSKVAAKSETTKATKRRKGINQDKTQNVPDKQQIQPPPTDLNPPGCSQTLDEKGWREDVSMPCRKTLAAYGKKPYLRLPPTAYLDEKYTAMPKRRKEMPSFQASRESVFPEPGCTKAGPQSHRCAKCFSTFSSVEELQSHNQLKKCSNLFGFDSDDEGNS